MTTHYKNDRLLKALRREPVDATPIWIMRQAGRYLPEYRATRSKIRDFMTFCKTPELACEVTLQPLARFDLDAAILFSDILTIADCWPLGLQFKEGEGPVIEKPLRNMIEIQQLPLINVEEKLGYVAKAIQLIKKELNQRVPLIGFAGSPWTQAIYMVEGGSSKTFNKIKGLMYKEPETLRLLLDKLTSITIDYLKMQIASGVDVIMLFDTWGGVLSSHAYVSFSLNSMEQIVSALKKAYPTIPIILFTKGGGLWLEKIASSHCDGIGIDWTVEMTEAVRRVGNKVALQGNLDPSALYGTKSELKREIDLILAAFKNKSGHVFNLGHGIYPDINPDQVAFMIDYVHHQTQNVGTNE